MAVEDVHRSEKPHDRLTKIADTLFEYYETLDAVTDEDRIIVMLNDKDRGSVAFHGYPEDDKDVEPITDMLTHLVAIFHAHGMTLSVVPLKERGRG